MRVPSALRSLLFCVVVQAASAANGGARLVRDGVATRTPRPVGTTQKTPITKLSRGGGLIAPSQTTLVRIGCLLAANSGFMNGLALSGAIIGKNQAVAAVTGAWTTSAVAAMKNEHSALQQQLVALVSYFGGSCINGLMNPNGIDWSKPPTSLVASAMLVLGAFGAAKKGTDPKVFWSLLTLANGLQNSWTSSLLQGNVLRTAHFSGITSDMGTFAGQMIRNNKQNDWKLVIFAKLAVSFWLGSAASYWMSQSDLFQSPEQCLLLNVAVYIGLWFFLQT